MGVIAYDKPVRDFIAGLNATGHVTHTQHRKTKVTLHHNGGRLSLEGILEVWKTRPASAHFQVDGAGAVGQYVLPNEYAWSTGNTKGNQESISIELANATLAPNWLVSELTMMEGARLAGWLFAKVIGEAPTRDNLKVHHDYKQTLCAGPCIDANYDRILEQAQVAYLFFVGQGAAPAPSPAPATPTPTTDALLPLDQIARQVIAGSWGSGDDRKARLRSRGYNYEQVQAEVNRLLGATPARKSLDTIADEVIAGHWGNNPERSRKLQAAGYSPTEVQAAVNAKLGGGSRPAVVRPSINVIADQVIAGQWGNGTERIRRITAAGYDYQAVRAVVNAKLR